MKRLAAAVAVLAVLSSAVPASAKLHTRLVEYKDGTAVLQGYAAWDDSFKGPRPGVLIAHEWWGFGPYVQRRARMLARLGYRAFALDLYGKGVHTRDHKKAAELSGVLFKDRAMMRRRAVEGLDQLKKLPGLDPSRLAAIGYCFGGAAALELARMGEDLRGVATFHGTLETSTPATETPKAKILVMIGADDSFVGPQVPAFEAEMRKVHADWEMITYGGAVHSFTVKEAGNDNSKGMAYNAEADARSWKAMKDFFAEVFKK
jgi:dienelactone hydrolase